MKLWMVALLALVGCDKGGDSAGDNLVGDPDRGATVFQNTCGNAKCHGPDGTSAGDKTAGANLAEEVPAKSDAEIRSIILNGEGKMPAVDPEPTDQQIADVIAYLRQEFPG